MSETCCGSENNVMILACSGASNVGQLSNQAAIELTGEGFGKMFCLAGIGGKLSGFVQSAKDAPMVIAIDGCQVGCAKTILENTEIPLKHYVVITDEGIKKNKNFNLGRADIDRVKSVIKQIVSSAKPNSAAASGEGCSCRSCC